MSPQTSESTEVTRRQVLLVAGPIILSNLSTPILGLVDTAVIGNLGDAALIGAIAVGSMVFSFLYWGFGFLRMGTTGLVAQARGARDTEEAKAAYFRAFYLGLLIGFTLMLLQYPIGKLAFSIIEGSPQVENAALTYFGIRIWAAPVSLAYLAIIGYLLGQQKSSTILVLQLILNGTNIVLDILFVVVFGWGVAGIAAATVIAEVLAFGIGMYLVHQHIREYAGSLSSPRARLMDPAALATTFSVNRDIMIRTLCLIFAFAWFTNEGAKSGDVILATNAILMQFVSFSAFFLDGYALAGESLVGSAVGARNRGLLKDTLRYITELGLATSVVVSLIFLAAGTPVVALLTNVAEVRDAADTFMIYAVMAPVISLWCYLLDGVFIGATRTAEMRNAMIVSLAAFLAAWYLLTPYGNHGLWLSLHIYFVARAVSLAVYLPAVYAQTR